ncbi:hypothetical protein E2C01_056729 [Portunus trituberculatus]|uniref:Uncharacterized protein n=1 Tax=Portunus trituberculatus TaxID=210409 RepID=A0A5B7GRL6_PORTR|nr:hypothetical protein [Portunus trituberculatus]
MPITTSGNWSSPGARETVQVRHLIFLADSDSLSLLTLPGLPTRIDPVSGNPSTLDLCLGNGPLLTTITTGSYMGIDHPCDYCFPINTTTPSHFTQTMLVIQKGRPDIFSDRVKINRPTHDSPIR